MDLFFFHKQQFKASLERHHQGRWLNICGRAFTASVWSLSLSSILGVNVKTSQHGLFNHRFFFRYMYFHMYFYYGEEFRLNVHTDWVVEANCGGFLYKHTALVLVVVAARLGVQMVAVEMVKDRPELSLTHFLRVALCCSPSRAFTECL